MKNKLVWIGAAVLAWYFWLRPKTTERQIGGEKSRAGGTVEY